MLDNCVKANVSEAYQTVLQLWRLGYSPEDIIGSIMRVTKNHVMPEYLKLEYIKVNFFHAFSWLVHVWFYVGNWIYAYANCRRRRFVAPTFGSCGSPLQESNSTRQFPYVGSRNVIMFFMFLMHLQFSKMGVHMGFVWLLAFFS